MTQHTTSTLSERQEMLLSKFYDGEASPLERLRARFLIKRRPAAADFLSSLQSLSSNTYSAATATTESCDLWDRISARIDAEEKAAFYLGKRSSTPTQESFISRLLSSPALFGGLSGAAVAAAILIAVYPASQPRELAIINAEPSALARATQGFHTVTLPNGQNRASSQTGPLGSRTLSSMEMDWMRGSGPLKIIQNPGSSSGVIWVKRSRSLRASASPAPTPLLRKPSATRKGIDDKGLRRSQ